MAHESSTGGITLMDIEPLFEGDAKPVHVFGCGCQIVDAVDKGPDGLPTTYWSLCAEHAHLNPDSMAYKERRLIKR